MRPIDADALLEEMVGITDGWLKPPKNWKWYEDSVRNAPTISSQVNVKAQEPVKPELRMSKHGFRQWIVCGNCYEKIRGGDNYCSHCGRKVKWE